MYRDNSISLVIPAYNEARLIRPTLENVPELIDRVYVVDDCSPDNQNEVIESCALQDPRITLLKHTENQGPGGAIITGYLASSEEGHDIAVVVGGDNQMKLDEVTKFLDPIIEDRADYTKGNRFLLSQLDDTLSKMSKTRLIGNWLITLTAKISSGYYKIMDFVDGYTAISKDAIDVIDWSKAWKGYGYPMDFLIRMNAYSFRTMDIPREAIYLPGERQSQIKGFEYFLKVTPMLMRNFLWRMTFKYLYRDFHPLLLFFVIGFGNTLLGTFGGLLLILDKLFHGGLWITPSRSILVALFLLSGIQLLLFAMFFDMEEGKSDRVYHH